QGLIMRVEVFTAASAFHDLRAEWHHVLSQLSFQSVFFTPQWQATWWRHFGVTRHLHLLTVRSDDGTLQGLAPLMSSNGAAAPSPLERLGDLYADGVPIAALWCFAYGATYAAYNSGYHPAYADLSAGIMLFVERIRQAIALRFTAFDFLRGHEPYK